MAESALKAQSSSRGKLFQAPQPCRLHLCPETDRGEERRPTSTALARPGSTVEVFIFRDAAYM